MRASVILSWLLVAALPGSVLFAGDAFSQASGTAEKPSDATQPSSGDGAAAPSEPKPKLGIDSLLRPRSMSAPRPGAPAPTEETHAGRNREAWAQAFADARVEVLEAEGRVEKTRKKVAEVPTSNYSYNPLGGTDSSTTDPEVVKLRAQLRRDRKDLEAAQSRFRDLQVEASLAGVPEEWIPSAPSSSPQSSTTKPAPSE